MCEAIYCDSSYAANVVANTFDSMDRLVHVTISDSKIVT